MGCKHFTMILFGHAYAHAFVTIRLLQHYSGIMVLQTLRLHDTLKLIHSLIFYTALLEGACENNRKTFLCVVLSYNYHSCGLQGVFANSGSIHSIAIQKSHFEMTLLALFREWLFPH